MFHLFSKLLTFKNYYLRTMKSIVLLGAGNVATHLCKAIHNLSDFKIIQVYNHSEKSLIYFPSTLHKTSLLTEIKEADLYIRNNDGYNAFELAEKRGHKEIAEYIKEKMNERSQVLKEVSKDLDAAK